MEELEDMNENNIKYLRRMYPDKKIDIKGYRLVSFDAISNLSDLKAIIKNNYICCYECGKRLNDRDGWMFVLHNPKDSKEPIELLFFCCSKDYCALEWEEKRKGKK